MPRPPIRVVGEHQQLALPGMLWPAGCDRGQGNPLFFEEIDKKQANELIVSFGHPLGEYNRSFGYQAWGLAIDGRPSPSPCRARLSERPPLYYSRYEVVELARIARHPDHPGVTRVMLRLWRDYLAGRWDYWDAPVARAVSYGLPIDENGRGTGNLYRFDGLESSGESASPGRAAASTPGATRRRPTRWATGSRACGITSTRRRPATSPPCWVPPDSGEARSPRRRNVSLDSLATW